MTDITFITPLAPYHDTLLARCIDSVQAQTVPCEHVVIRDEMLRGPGRIRNEALRQVTTPFVVFLDADDWIAPMFAERCLAAFDGRRYVYTDWWEDDRYVSAPGCAWVNRTWHVITALVPTGWARAVGGFSETLQGAEDTEFYLKLTTSGYCGKRLSEPLFFYGKEGQRAKTFVHSADFEATMDRFSRQFGGKQMACCGGNTPVDTPPVGERQEGDVLVTALWAGNRQERGKITGRFYPRTGNGKQVWVAAVDADARPDLWQRVVDPFADEYDDAPDVIDVIGGYFGLPKVTAPPPTAPAVFAQPVPPVEKAPDIAKLLKKANRRG